MRYESVDSTNSVAQDLAQSGAEDWTVVVADVQTHGRGRHGRHWSSPLGGLWFSVIFRPRLPAEKAPILQFYTSNAVREAVDQSTGVPIQGKWPNDLLIDDRKVGGILVEVRSAGSGLAWAILGIGLNVNVSGEALPNGAVSLAAASKHALDNRGLLDSILKEMVSLRPTIAANPRVLLDEWWDHCMHRERKVEVLSSEGTVLTGKSVELTNDGGLALETLDASTRIITEGTLRLLRD